MRIASHRSIAATGDGDKDESEIPVWLWNRSHHCCPAPRCPAHTHVDEYIIGLGAAAATTARKHNSQTNKPGKVRIVALFRVFGERHRDFSCWKQFAPLGVCAHVKSNARHSARNSAPLNMVQTTCSVTRAIHTRFFDSISFSCDSELRSHRVSPTGGRSPLSPGRKLNSNQFQMHATQIAPKSAPIPFMEMCGTESGAVSCSELSKLLIQNFQLIKVSDFHEVFGFGAPVRRRSVNIV